MISNVRHTDCERFACIRITQSDFMEETYCKKYQWDPKIRNLISVSKMAAVSRSNCRIFVIFTSTQLWILQMWMNCTNLLKHFKIQENDSPKITLVTQEVYPYFLPCVYITNFHLKMIILRPLNRCILHRHVCACTAHFNKTTCNVW